MRIKAQLEQLWEAGKLPAGVLLAGQDYGKLVDIAGDLSEKILGSVAKNNPDFLHLDLQSVENTRDLISFISLKSFGKRVVILGHAENLNTQSVNALLKTLEEPGADTYFFVLTSQEQALLPTLRSRLMAFRYGSEENLGGSTITQEFIEATDRTSRVLAIGQISDEQTLEFLQNLYKQARFNLSHNTAHRLELILNTFSFLRSNVAAGRALAYLAIKW